MANSYVFAIDPGNIESGYVVIDADYRPIEAGKIFNNELIDKLNDFLCINSNQEVYIAIEMVACYGMPVGKSLFDTCVWIGRFSQFAVSRGIEPTYIYRKDEKMNLCHTMKAKDSNITQALVDRFTPNAANHGKGTKGNPGWFYGFKKDIWQAYAVGVTYMDLYER